MEFQFNVNDALPDPICVVDENLAPFARKFRHDRMTFSAKQAQLKKIIDHMGEASTKSQNLRSPITSAIKLLHSDHRLYIYKDSAANNGMGAVVGIIKLGHKNLFVQDQGVQYEVYPLCILDFYVHESRQRTGCGKTLFEHVLKTENINVEQLAIDKPSHKFLSFLKKHYNLDKPIPQVNNFVLYAGFFHDLQAVGLVPKRGQRFSNPGSTSRPPMHLYKRQNNENNEHSVTKRQAINCQSPVNQASSQQYEPESTIQVQPMDTSCSTTHRSIAPTSTQAARQDISLPPIVTRPPGRHSASRSQIGSSGSRWMLESSLAGGSTFPDAFNAERGMAARATAYSRYNSSRENSAPVLRTTAKDTPQGSKPDSFERVSSGVRKRNLHLTSDGNPLQTETLQTPVNKSQPVQTNRPIDMNANQTTNNTAVNPSYLNSAGNYTISQMYNTFYGKQRSLGTGWNVFGVPTDTGMLSSRKNVSRTFPY